MSEEENTDAPDAQEADDAAEEFDAERAKAKIAKANSEAKNLRKRLTELEAKAKKLDELEDAKKSETERLTEQQKSLEDRAAKAEADAARLRVAMTKGLSESQARRLVGSSVEELEADADDLLASFTPASDDRPEREGNPTPRLRGGGDPTEEPEELDPRKLAERAPRL